MNPVGIVSITVGVLGVCYGGYVVVAPAASLRGFEGIIRSSGRTRAFGAFLLPLGALLVWAGATEDAGFNLNAQSTLAFILSLIGWLWLVVSTPMLVLVPQVFRAVVSVFLGPDRNGRLNAWRALGVVRIAVNAPFIYFGALAL